MRVVFFMFVSMLWCGACASSERVDESRLPEDFTFRWRFPTQMAVTETVSGPGGDTVIAYTAEVVREGDHLRLRHLDGEVHRVGDIDVDFEAEPTEASRALGITERQRNQARTAVALADVTDAVISREGRVLKCEASPAMRARASSYFEAQPKATRVAYEIQMREAADVAVAKQTCVERWQAWVSAWIGFEALPGMDDQWFADTDVPVGEDPKIQVFDVHVGWLKKGGVRVTRRQEIDGAALDDERPLLATELTAELKSPIVADRVTIASATWLGTADIDPKTLRPRKIEWLKTLRYALDGMQDQRVVRRTWTFTYSAK